MIDRFHYGGIENGMLIKSFYNDLNDRELRNYGKFLREVMEKKPFADIREIIMMLKKKYPKNIINWEKLWIIHILMQISSSI